MTQEQLMKIQNQPKEFRNTLGFELRKEDESKMTIEGYALNFNKETIIGGSFREVILKGALDATDMKKVPLKYNHNDSYLVMASTKNKSLELKIDDKGLYFKAELINTSSNKDMYESIKSGLISECSFAFTIPVGGSEWIWPEDPKELPVRQIKKIDRLYDIALVDLPAYGDTSVNARSFEEFENAKKAVEAEKKSKNDLQIRMRMKLKIKN